MNKWATKARFATMGLASQGQGGFGCGSTSIAALLDPLPFHICHLGQHSYYKLAYAPSDRTKAPNVYGDALIKQLANDTLNVEGITA